MSYLDIIRKLEEELSGGGKPLPEAGKVTSEAGTQCEKSELSEISPLSVGPAPTCEPAESSPDTVCPSCPGPERCAGCYSLGVIDGRERFIHPPKPSREWEAWLRKWQPRGKVQ